MVMMASDPCKRVRVPGDAFTIGAIGVFLSKTQVFQVYAKDVNGCIDKNGSSFRKRWIGEEGLYVLIDSRGVGDESPARRDRVR